MAPRGELLEELVSTHWLTLPAKGGANKLNRAERGIRAGFRELEGWDPRRLRHGVHSYGYTPYKYPPTLP